ncbi:MBL fold metallo-hydrolase RNA specificity domain-containing protein [Pseudidiomarina insulisalsae]|uniref:MBL fold hydrolase n=1 Tax=Pseudidiomarina insulisalsae TaxID=575789 RepID=A0A432YLJ3_9GAMM|nr:MBL fold metallo-hydrolase [Pseudidiomarina insulisalsae]RUO61812.1 MBL fold hydrolase [Pseudidiomarina insulisalsae]
MKQPPKVIHHGAFAGVTGSCHQLFLARNQSVLIDCGLFQGAETSGRGADADTQAIEFDISFVRALIVTHTHIDHVGRIPYLLMAGFRGPIYCTHATALLLPLVIEDALKIGLTRDRKLISSVLTLLRSLLRPLDYDAWQALDVADVQLRFRQAGHILGSAYVEFEWLESSYRVVFSGDLGCRNTPLLPDPTPLERADLLFLESTYGNRNHESREDRAQRLRSVIERCVLDRGTVLIPAFSIGRTQELLYEIEDLIASAGDIWPQMTVILDSPMAAEFTSLYSQLSSLWDAEALARHRSGRNPLDFARLHTVRSHEEHERVVNFLRSSGEPCIVIAASGMCTGGRMVNYLRALLPDPRTDVLFVGYQAAGTPGRVIQQYGPAGGYVELDGERVTIRAGVHTLGGYSAHADQQELLDFVLQATSVGSVRLIHGDRDARVSLAALLCAHGVAAVADPTSI